MLEGHLVILQLPYSRLRVIGQSYPMLMGGWASRLGLVFQLDLVSLPVKDCQGGPLSLLTIALAPKAVILMQQEMNEV